MSHPSSLAGLYVVCEESIRLQFIFGAFRGNLTLVIPNTLLVFVEKSVEGMRVAARLGRIML